MFESTLHTHLGLEVARVDPRIFGGFLEHLGRAVYDGVWDLEEHQTRAAVKESLKPLAMTAMRYPGGNFVSGYHWQDGVGPRDQRPTVRDLAWQSLEPNHFGTHEFLDLCDEMDWTPMLAVNLGTGTPEEARAWLEYLNLPTGTRWADLRASHGFAAPRPVKLWCLGNEMDGPWQIGHMPAQQYAVLAQQTARMMKMVDPEVELVACGSCGPFMSTFGDWDRTVLEHCGDAVDYLSVHRYVGNKDGDTEDFLATGVSIDRQIEETAAFCRASAARARSKKVPRIAFDEWNVWYRETGGDGRGVLAPHLLEEVYNLEDALVVAQFLNSFIRHADVVAVANIAQIVNVIAPVITRGSDVVKQTIWHAFAMFAGRRSGTSLRCSVSGPQYGSASYGEVNRVDASVIREGGLLHVHLVNRHPSESAAVRIDLGGGELGAWMACELLTGTSPQAANTFEYPEAVVSQTAAPSESVVELPPLSFFSGTVRLS